jgi:outer membrane protein TolC
VETALGPQRHAIALRQTFPWFGKLSLRGDAAEQGALAAEQRFRQARLDLFARTARTYYEYAYLARAVDVTRENLELMRYQESVARAKYTTDTARYSELVKAQVELGVLEDRLQTLEDQRGALMADLNAALGRDAAEPLPWPVPLDEPPVEIPSDEMVREVALRENPSLLAAEREVEQQDRLAALARRNRYPDFTIGVNTVLTDESDLTSFDPSGRDAWMGTLSLRLPLWQGKYSAAIREADARRRAAEYEVTSRRQHLDADVDGLLFRLRDAQRKIDLYRDNLVPKAEQALHASETAYRAGEASLLDFLDAERTYLRFELELARAQADWGQRSIEVMALMGQAPVETPDPIVPDGRDDRQGDSR